METKNEVPKRVRPKVNTGPGLTKQNHKKECDINLILAKYQKTGMVTFVNNNKGTYEDIEPIEFQDALNLVIGAREMFEQIPSSVRKRFGNDPKEFYEFLHNSDNQEEIYNLGLADRPPPPPREDPAPVEKTPPKEA